MGALWITTLCSFLFKLHIYLMLSSTGLLDGLLGPDHRKGKGLRGTGKGEEEEEEMKEQKQ